MESLQTRIVVASSDVKHIEGWIDKKGNDEMNEKVLMFAK